MLYLTLWQYQYETDATNELGPGPDCVGVFSPIDDSAFGKSVSFSDQYGGVFEDTTKS